MRNVAKICSNGDLKIYTIDFNEPKYGELLNCKHITGFSVSHFDYYGYKLALFVDDFGIVNEYNHYVSKLTLREIHGDAILIDDEIDLSIEEVKELYKILKKDKKLMMERSEKAQIMFKEMMEKYS